MIGTAAIARRLGSAVWRPDHSRLRDLGMAKQVAYEKTAATRMIVRPLLKMESCSMFQAARACSHVAELSVIHEE